MKLAYSTTDKLCRRFSSGAAVALALSSVLAGCSGDDGTTSTTGSTSESSTTGSSSSSSSASSTTGSTSASSSSGTGGSGGSQGNTGGGGAGPTKPADCVDLPLAGIKLVSQQQNQFDTSDSVSLVRTPSALANVAGDPALFDRVRILFDGATGVGVHALDPDPTHALPDYVASYVPTCSACVVYQEDLDATSSEYKKVFAAKSGELEITTLLTPHQTVGTARHVELREVAADAATGAYGWVAGGSCYWIEETTYDVRRPNGCTPFVAGACPSGQYCMPTNAIGSDGECVTGGAKMAGEACDRPSATAWDSDCALGLRCIDFGSGATCNQVCDIVSTTPGCPDGTHCGGGYNVCADEAELMTSGIDEATVGTPCATVPTALYCGGSGRPGTCWDDDGDAGPLPPTCVPWASAPSQCVAPQTAGYVAYKEGIDKSTLWCITPP